MIVLSMIINGGHKSLRILTRERIRCGNEKRDGKQGCQKLSEKHVYFPSGKNRTDFLELQTNVYPFVWGEKKLNALAFKA